MFPMGGFFLFETMEIYLGIFAAFLMLTAAVISALAASWFTAKKVLAAMVKAGQRRERRLSGQIKALAVKNDLLIDKLLVKAGLGQLRAPEVSYENKPTRPTHKIVAPSEAIAEQIKRDRDALPARLPERVPSSVGAAFMSDAAKLNNAGAVIAPRNGNAGENSILPAES